MQNARLKTLITIKYCCLISLVKPGTMRHALSSCVKIDSWLMKQSKSLMERSCNTALKIKFDALPPPEFWIYTVCPGSVRTVFSINTSRELFSKFHSFYSK
jgi:hypothetical protein